ncbi:hypothetical protein QPK87_20770 [Kamptonema cortianum]|nr:hypothetical protein [Kamptonema cortianum]
MRAAVPVARLLLAALLVFGGEILLWQDPLSRSPLEWLMVAAGYTAIACLLLEIAARFRWREIYGLLALAGIYALLNAVLINPTLSFADFPRTLFTRVLGAQALTGALMLAAWRWLLIPPRRPPLVPLLLCAITGAGWGIWARWSASLFRGDAVLRDTPFMTIALIGLIALALIAALRRALMRAASETSLTSAHFSSGACRLAVHRLHADHAGDRSDRQRADQQHRTGAVRGAGADLPGDDLLSEACQRTHIF